MIDSGCMILNALAADFKMQLVPIEDKPEDMM